MEGTWNIVEEIDGRLVDAGGMSKFISKKGTSYYRLKIKGRDYLAFPSKKEEGKKQNAL